MKIPKRNSNPHWYVACIPVILFVVILFLPVSGNSYFNLHRESGEHWVLSKGSFNTTNIVEKNDDSAVLANRTRLKSKLIVRRNVHLSSTRLHHPGTASSKTTIKSAKSLTPYRKHRTPLKRHVELPGNTSPDKFFTLLGSAVQMEALHFHTNALQPAEENWQLGLDSIVQPYINGMQEYDSILIVGYTDNTGSKRGNLQLSEQRAKNIAAWLVKQGIPENLVRVVAAGQDYPVATNKTRTGRNSNRRVEINFLKG